MRFKIGSWYSFIIESIIDIPEKGNHFVLRHESGRKMLLDSRYYVKYELNLGQTLACRVDKLNCAGQVFLEPKHPHYNEGSIYSFDYLGVKQNEDKTTSILINDTLNNEIQVLLNSNLEQRIDGQVQLKVERIKKGIPILSCPLIYNKPTCENVSGTIYLKVVAIITENLEEYYSLADNTGKIISRLKVKHYKHFGYEIGSNILCQKRDNDLNGLMLVEPENPWYKIGESYIFIVSSIENVTNLDGEEIFTIILLDNFSNKCGISVSVEQMKQFVNKTEIKCVVIGFRKGRPQLEIDLN
jgi:hypothetical protein